MVSVRDAHFSEQAFDIFSWSQQHCATLEQAQALSVAYRLGAHSAPPNQLQAQERAREMLECLSALEMDSATLQAAVLWVFLEFKLVSELDVQTQSSPAVQRLVARAQSLDDIQRLSQPANELSALQVDNMRRMLLAMVDDVRVVVLKLAEQVCVLREAKTLEEEAKVLLARDVVNVYAPLANRLGIGQLKWELDDLAFRYLNPHIYKSIAEQLDEKRIHREAFIADFVAQLQHELGKLGLSAKIYGRPKHIASIYKKMQQKNLDFDQLFDVRAVRILTDRVDACYQVLSVIHTLFDPIAEEFDDYIASPKANGYQSIHTVVLAGQRKAVEVQIRTEQMDQDAELGVAAHWKYKEGVQTSKASGYEDKINWLRNVLKWKDDLYDLGAVSAFVESNVFEDRVYAFTPRGDVMNLPLGATVLDFAYYIHSQVGHQTIQVKVDGRIVPFHHQVRTGEQVEVVTSKQGKPKRDWLNPNLGYIHTAKARGKIQQWFRLLDRDKHRAVGKEIFERELERELFEVTDLQALAKHFNFVHSDEMLCGLGAGTFKITKVLAYVQQQKAAQASDLALVAQAVKKSSAPKTEAKHSIEVNGVGNLMTQFAKCCQPLPGEFIMGYITKGRGVTIHRESCDQLAEMTQQMPARVVDVAWGSQYHQGYSVSLTLDAQDRSGLLRDIVTLVTQAKNNIIDLNSHTDVKQQTTRISLVLEMFDVDALSKLMQLLKQVPGVYEVSRKADKEKSQ
jgi:GTP pyrophosphokinase